MALENLNDVRVFLQVVEAGNLSAAARILGAPANTVSRTIARLEESLGARLLTRTTRKMSLTDEGQTFYERALALIEAADLAEEAVTRDRGGLSGTIRVAVRTTTVQFSLLADLAQLLATHPQLRVQLIVTDAEVDLVAQGLDVALRIGSLADSTLRSRSIGTVTFVLAATAEYLKRRGTPRTPAELATHDFILPTRSRVRTPMALLGPRGTRLTVMVGGRFECEDVRTQREALWQGLGIAARPLGDVVLGGPLERVLPAWQLEPIPVYAVFPPRRPSAARARGVDALVTLLTKAVLRMGASEPPGAASKRPARR